MFYETDIVFKGPPLYMCIVTVCVVVCRFDDAGHYILLAIG